ncbi:MAG TPA: R3H domain-containing nucleic acid-binding protein, partial [Thermoanaerobaculia bacterium]|nr:R3H domain-containing nucleic acid-binding protein [Thermoanaerobaculia bacterium]
MSDSESKRKYFSGRSVEQAVTAAASHYGIDPSELKYREIDKRHGFVRTRRKAVIAVEPDDFRKAPEEARPTRPEAQPTRSDAQPTRSDAQPTRQSAPAPPPAPSPPPGPSEAAEEEREATPRDRERPPRGREEDAGRREPRRPRLGERREEAEPARTPWWHAQPVGGEDEEEAPAAEREEVPAEAAEEDEEPPAELREEPQPGRYRFVERSEGLRRRGGPLPPAAGGDREQAGRPAPEGERRPRGRRGGRRGRERGAGAEEGRAGGRGGSRDREERGGRGRRPEAAPPPEVAAPPLVRPAPRSERLPRVEGELAEAAQEALDMLFELTDVEAEADFFRDEERLEVELWGPDDHILLQDDGQLLLAIEHLLPRMLRGLIGDTMPVRVDCNDFHFLREERLRDLALRTAGEVRRRGRPRTLDELDPAERRIVHLTLADDPDVTTDS